MTHRTFADLTEYEHRCMGRQDAPLYLARPDGSSSPVPCYSLDTARDYAIRLSGIGTLEVEVWGRQDDGAYQVLEVLDRSNGGAQPTQWHYLHGPAIPDGWYTQLPAPRPAPVRPVHCAWAACSRLHQTTADHRARYGPYCGAADCQGSRVYVPGAFVRRPHQDDTDPAERAPGPNGGHFDVRLVCQETGRLEATEETGLTFARAHAFVYGPDRSPTGRYVIVFCERPGSDPVHDVDVDYHTHATQHVALWAPGAPLERWVGAPVPFDWERPDVQPERS